MLSPAGAILAGLQDPHCLADAQRRHHCCLQGGGKDPSCVLRVGDGIGDDGAHRPAHNRARSLVRCRAASPRTRASVWAAMGSGRRRCGKSAIPPRRSGLRLCTRWLAPSAGCLSGVREMVRVARRAVVIAEPADAALTRLAIKLGISGEYEEAGNYVYRLRKEKLIEVFRDCGLRRWRFRRNLIYYQPWTFRAYRWCDSPPLFWLFRAGFHLANLLLGRWGNSLRAVAWKSETPDEVRSPPSGSL